MRFDPPFNQATLIKRYKRFLVDVDCGNGQLKTIHCPNTGSMRNCIESESRCWYSLSDNKKRKYPETLEIVTTPSGHLAGVNTSRANKLVAEAIGDGVIRELRSYSSIKPEIKCPELDSRIDFLLTGHKRDPRECYVEVKSVTLLGDGGETENQQIKEGRGFFPDSVSERGTKHLKALMNLVDRGKRAVIFYCVQHSGIESVSPADRIDKIYGETLRKAVAQGVEVLAYRAEISDREIRLTRPLPIIL